MPYVTELGGGAIICDAEGNVVARRSKGDGAGVVVADIEVGRVNTTATVPAGFWVQELEPFIKIRLAPAGLARAQVVQATRCTVRQR